MNNKQRREWLRDKCKEVIGQDRVKFLNNLVIDEAEKYNNGEKINVFCICKNGSKKIGPLMVFPPRHHLWNEGCHDDCLDFSIVPMNSRSAVLREAARIED